MSAGKNVVESFREAVQDLLVPELKAVKVSVESLHAEMSYLRGEMKLRDEKMEQLIRSGNERLEQMIHSGNERLEQMIHSGDARLEQLTKAGEERLEHIIRLGDEKNEQATRALADKLDFAIDVRERLATLEARQPRQ